MKKKKLMRKLVELETRLDETSKAYHAQYREVFADMMTAEVEMGKLNDRITELERYEQNWLEEEETKMIVLDTIATLFDGNIRQAAIREMERLSIKPNACINTWSTPNSPSMYEELKRTPSVVNNMVNNPAAQQQQHANTQLNQSLLGLMGVLKGLEEKVATMEVGQKYAEEYRKARKTAREYTAGMEEEVTDIMAEELAKRNAEDKCDGCECGCGDAPVEEEK